MKIGGPTRGERVAKWNRLLEIDAELNASGRALPLDVPAPLAAAAGSAQSLHRSKGSRARGISVANISVSALGESQQIAPSATSATASGVLAGAGGIVSGTASVTGAPTTGAPVSAIGAASEVSVSARFSTSSAAEAAAAQATLRKVAPARVRVFELRQRRERALVGAVDELTELPAEGQESKRTR